MSQLWNKTFNEIYATKQRMVCRGQQLFALLLSEGSLSRHWNRISISCEIYCKEASGVSWLLLGLVIWDSAAVPEKRHSKPFSCDAPETSLEEMAHLPHRSQEKIKTHRAAPSRGTQCPRRGFYQPALLSIVFGHAEELDVTNCSVHEDDTQPFVSGCFSAMQRESQSPDLCEATATAPLCKRGSVVSFRLVHGTSRTVVKFKET